MKKNLLFYLLMSTLFVAGFSLKGNAQLLFEENFAYPVGDLLTAHGWANHSGTSNFIAVTAASISYSNYQSSGIGEEVTLTSSGEDVNKQFTAQTSGSVYAGLLVNVTSVATTGDYFFHLGATAMGTNFKGRLFVKKDASNNLAFGIAHSTTAANYSAFNYALNTTYLIVVKYTINSGTANDVVSIYVNPVIGDPEPASPLVTNTDTPNDPADIGTVALRQGTAGNLVGLKLDGIRIGTTWSSVVGLAAPVSLTVTSPTAGEEWEQGSTHNITWNASGTNANVKIEYTDNASAGTPTWITLVASVPAANESWTWNIPAGQPLSTDSKIRITDVPQTVSATSGIFSIISPPAPVATLAELRAGTPGVKYRYTGNGILTFQQTFRHQKFIQDATAAILIDDNGGEITTTYALGDAITNIIGTVAVFNGMTQFTPLFDPGAPASSGNTITPEVVSLATLNANWENYESELIKIPNITFTGATGNFANGTIYPVTDINSTAANFRTTFYDVDYIGTPVPSAREDIVVIPNSRVDGDFITARSLADFIYNSSDNIMITEIMYNPPDAGNDTIEFIEVFNKGVSNVNLNGWYFSKGITYIFPDTTLGAGNYFVVARDAISFNNTFGFSPAQWTDGVLNNFGSEIELKDALGNVKDYVHYLPALPWDTLADGHGPSLEICDPNADNSLPESWSASRVFAGTNGIGESIFATPNARCGTGANLVITEIMYNSPESGTDTLEFIEIYNNGADINLQGFTFSEGVSLTFPSYDLAANHYVLVAASSAAMQNTFGVSSIQWTSGALSNSGENITIVDPYGYIIDHVPYDDQTPWDSLADGFGPSLTLCDPNSDNSLAVNWKASSEYAATNAAGDSIYATPGSGCVNPPAFADFVAVPTNVFVGDFVQFTDLSANNPTSWQWSFPGGTPESSAEQNPSIQYNTFGVYPVTLTATNTYGSGTMTKTDYIHVDIDGISLVTGDKVTIYPNPASGKVSVTNPTGSAVNVTVISLLGTRVANLESANDVINLDLSQVPGGIYLVKLTLQDGRIIATRKLILK
ncbi:MAG TPA: lamin tail domain-containing protein [Bacteroidales bacterium]|nr:lamin tail domain-containing protein [Bacteroidales bacterium]